MVFTTRCIERHVCTVFLIYSETRKMILFNHIVEAFNKCNKTIDLNSAPLSPYCVLSNWTNLCHHTCVLSNWTNIAISDCSNVDSHIYVHILKCVLIKCFSVDRDKVVDVLSLLNSVALRVYKFFGLCSRWHLC